MNNEFIREGMRITLKLLAEMNEVCRRENIRFVVAVIPTKETVFAEHLEHNANLPLSTVLDKLIAGEREARATMFAFFATSGIEYVDLLPPLRRSIDQQLYARSASDMHPNRNGYRVIGEAIYQALKTRSATPSGAAP
jgi:lysophospholipase L1-like esterase